MKAEDAATSGGAWFEVGSFGKYIHWMWGRGFMTGAAGGGGDGGGGVGKVDKTMARMRGI